MKYAEKVGILLMRHYGITLDDCIEPTELEECEASGQQSFEVVNGIADKRDLDRLDTTAFMSSKEPLTEKYQYFGKGKKRTAKPSPFNLDAFVLG